MAAVFAASSNTPLALSIMAVELVGVGVFPHAVIVCVLAYVLSGHRSISSAQRLLQGKEGSPLSGPTALRDFPLFPSSMKKALAREKKNESDSA
jgi:H+/Cl- antiporter ClcA